MSSNERQLTEAESRRNEAFKLKSEELIGRGFVRKDLTITIMKANVVGVLLTLPFMALVVLAYYLRNGDFGINQLFEVEPLQYFIGLAIFFVSYLVLICFHEGIHGLCWGFGAEHGFKDIEFGFIKKNLTPYCTCSSPLSKPRYIFGSLMPMTVLGLGISIVGVFIANPLILCIGLIQILGGAGDILISCMLIFHNTRGKEAVLLDHPTECGLVVFEKGAAE